MDLDGNLIGTSDGGAATVVYYTGAAEQRVGCTASGCTTAGDGSALTSSIVRLVHTELLRRFGSLRQWRDTSAKETLIVGHGHEAGPLLLSTTLITSGQDGIEWILCVALNSDELLRPYEEEYLQAVIFMSAIMIFVIILFAGLSLINVNDALDRQWFKLVDQCRRDNRNLRQGWRQGEHDRKISEEVLTPENDFVRFVENTRALLLVDVEVSALLLKIRHKSVPATWNADLWFDELMTRNSADQEGPAFMKSIVENRAPDDQITGLSVAKLLLHIGYSGSAKRGLHSLATLHKLQQFAENTAAHAWAWDSIVSAKEVSAPHTAHIINSTGLVTSTLDGKTAAETRHFIDRQWKTISSPEFWEHVSDIVQADDSIMHNHVSQLV